MTIYAAATALMVVLASTAIGWMTTRLGVLVALWGYWRFAGASWVEQARQSYPARLVAAQGLAITPFAVGAILGSQVAPRLGLPVVPLTIVGSLAAVGVSMFEVLRLERRFCRAANPRGAQPRGIALSFVLVLPTLVIFGLMVATMPMTWGWPAALVLAAGLAAMGFHICGGTIILLRSIGLARPASPRLTAIVDEAAGTMGIRHRGVIELDSPNANALAWPVPRLVVFTGPIGEILDDAELASIAAHELGHLNESWGVYLTRIISALFLVACATVVPLMTSFGAIAGLVPMAFLLLLIVFGRRIGRKMEERSDKIGRDYQGEDAGTYARALAMIYEANLIPVVMRTKRAVHPDLYDRLIAAGVSPDYPRPAPPRSIVVAILPLLLLVVAAVLAVLMSAGLASSGDFPDAFSPD